MSERAFSKIAFDYFDEDMSIDKIIIFDENGLRAEYGGAKTCYKIKDAFYGEISDFISCCRIDDKCVDFSQAYPSGSSEHFFYMRLLGNNSLEVSYDDISCLPIELSSFIHEIKNRILPRCHPQR